MNVKEQITKQCQKLESLLLAKNSNYGNSALGSNESLTDWITPETGILIRMNDKISRLKALYNGEPDLCRESKSDTLRDLAGYCILALIALENADASQSEGESQDESTPENNNSMNEIAPMMQHSMRIVIQAIGKKLEEQDEPETDCQKQECHAFKIPNTENDSKQTPILIQFNHCEFTMNNK